MKRIIQLIMFLFFFTYIYPDEYKEYNQEIESNINLIKNQEIKTEFKENERGDLDKFGGEFYYKLKLFERKINKNINDVIIPKEFREEMEIDLELTTFKDIEKLKLEYTYKPLENNRIKLILEEELILKYIYKKNFKDLFMPNFKKSYNK